MSQTFLGNTIDQEEYRFLLAQIAETQGLTELEVMPAEVTAFCRSLEWPISPLMQTLEGLPSGKYIDWLTEECFSMKRE